MQILALYFFSRADEASIMHKTRRRVILKIFAWVSAAILMLVIVVPLVVYQHALGLVDGVPQKPVKVLGEGKAAELWISKEKCTPEECSSLTSYWLYRWLAVAVVNDHFHNVEADTYHNVSKKASGVAITYMREGHFKGKGMLWWHLTHACLGIWVQRNWSANEITSKYKQINALQMLLREDPRKQRSSREKITMRHDSQYENDATPSKVVIERYRSRILDDESDASLALVHYRGGREELALGIEYSSSSDPLDRITGADILGQLGWGDRTFLDESIGALFPLLEDADDDVVFAAAVALGHRGDPRAIPALLDLANHPNANVRLGIVHGLTGHSHPDAIQAMVRLSADSDHDVRNWATFGLGSQIDTDTPEIRCALRANLADSDHEIRGEAIVGLAERKDPQIADILIHEWESNDIVSRLSLEAAELAADVRLLDHLESFMTELSLEDDPSFKSVLDDAIKACRGGAEPEAGGDA